MNTESIALMITTIIAVISAVIAVTAMITIMKEKVADHETRLQFHSAEIRRIDVAVAQSTLDFGVIKEMINAIKETLEDIKKRQCM